MMSARSSQRDFEKIFCAKQRKIRLAFFHCFYYDLFSRIKELPPKVYKRLHIIPETFIVDEHHLHVYASKSNTGDIVTAPRPADLFRNSIATPALVASIINGKYVNALPLERQSKTFKCNGINLNSNTMANWVIGSSEQYLSLIYDRLHEHIYDSKVIHADETPVKVMRIEGKKISGGRKTYMWVYRNRPRKNPRRSYSLTGSHPGVPTTQGNS